ncbi:hypothetical protein AGDE_09003 [Angomonas deanei]|nr:hypothetical protein AGDE_09003 [Angomonas deanei]|eukprot:EPY31536.1 hypothetical protein AGDE_09003 [Angomonas deanei]
MVRSVPLPSLTCISSSPVSALPRDALHFAHRAVKTTSHDPHFVCNRRELACQSPSSAAVVSLRSGKSTKEGGGSGGGLSAQVRLRGNSAVCIYRRGAPVFQCMGNDGSDGVTGGDFQLWLGDTYVVVCGVSNQDRVLKSFQLVEQYLREENCTFNMESLLGSNTKSKKESGAVLDLEYIAEDFLLDLQSSSSTVVLGRVFSSTPSQCPVPPTSERNCEEQKPR